MKEKILLTGANGRLGRRVAKALLEEGFEVKAVDKKINGLKQELSNYLKNKKLELIEVDLLQLDEKKLNELCQGIDFVIHLAALIDYTAKERDLIKVNWLATASLANAARKMGVKGFVLASSTSVTRKPCYLPIDEKHPFTPRNAYGRSKMFAEFSVKKSGLDYIILRMTIIYGKGFEEGFSQVVKGIKKGKMKLIGSGENRIAFVHINDVVNAFLLSLKALEKGKVKKETFIITGKPFTQKECFEEIARQLRVEPPKQHVNKSLAYLMAFFEEKKASLLGKKPKIMREHVHTLGEDRWFNTEKAEKELGWKPKVEFRTGLREFLRSIDLN